MQNRVTRLANFFFSLVRKNTYHTNVTICCVFHLEKKEGYRGTALFLKHRVKGERGLKEHRDKDKRVPSIRQRLSAGFLQFPYCPVPRHDSQRPELEEHQPETHAGCLPRSCGWPWPAALGSHSNGVMTARASQRSCCRCPEAAPQMWVDKTTQLEREQVLDIHSTVSVRGDIASRSLGTVASVKRILFFFKELKE